MYTFTYHEKLILSKNISYKYTWHSHVLRQQTKFSVWKLDHYQECYQQTFRLPIRSQNLSNLNIDLEFSNMRLPVCIYMYQYVYMNICSSF